MANDKKEDKKVKLVIGKIDLPKIDVEKYIGKKVEIESVDIYEGTFGMYVKVLTEVLETMGSGKNAQDIRASKILGLQQDKDGKWGFGDGTKLDLFLQKYDCEELKDLIGKTVILQVQTSKDNTDFISFN